MFSRKSTGRSMGRRRVAMLSGKTKTVATRVFGLPQGIFRFYRIAETFSVDADSGSMRGF